MPAAEKYIYRGFKVSARPAWWLRRWTRFPLYFQAAKPRFELIVKRISDEPSQAKELKFYLKFPDKTDLPFKIDVSLLQVGQTKRHRTQKVLFSPTGDTSICLDTGRSIEAMGGSFLTLYAFVVSPEATLVFLILNVILGALFSLLVALLFKL